MLLQNPISRLLQLLERQDELPLTLIERSRELQERMESGQLHLAVLGQFKRGKSSLINALLGAEVLPQGVLPVTLIPVFIRYGSQPTAQVTFEDGHTETQPLTALRDFVSETANPRNQKGVSLVEVSYPSPLLRQGIVLIDTPGVGSTHQHNTEATLAALPRFDAAVMVLSVDPPITAAEIEFLQQVRQHVEHLFFVLNKIDYLKQTSKSDGAHAQALTEAEEFLQRALTESGIAASQPSIFSLSALQGLEARLRDDPALWEESGLASFEAALMNLANHRRAEVLEQAIRRKAQNVAIEAEHLLALRQQALQLPLTELEQRIEAFGECAKAAQRKREEIRDRLVGDERRLRASLEEMIEVLRRRVVPEIEHLASQAGIPTRDPSQNEAFQQAVGLVFDRAREEIHQRFIKELTQVLETRSGEACAVREKLRQEASNLLEIPHSPPMLEESRVELSGPAWSLKQIPLGLKPAFGEELLPRAIRVRHEMERRRQLAQELAINNAEKIRWWLLQTAKESLSRLRLRIDQELEDTIQQIDQALQTGYSRHRLEAGELKEALLRLEESRAELRELAETLGQVRTIPSDCHVV